MKSPTLLAVVLSVLFANVANAKLKIYYIRHAEAGHNVKKAWQAKGIPEAEWPAYVGDKNAFTPLGLTQVTDATEKLQNYEFDLIATSPAWRAHNTIMPYLKLTKQKAEIWPELREGPGMTTILSDDIPDVKEDILNKGTAIIVANEDAGHFAVRSDVENNYKKYPKGASEEEKVAYMKHASLHAIKLIEKRFGGTDRSILLAGHNSAGVSLMKLLLKKVPSGKATRRGLTNTGIWMVDQKEDGSYELKIYNDEPYHETILDSSIDSTQKQADRLVHAQDASDESDKTPKVENRILHELLEPSSSRVFIAAHRGGYENDKKDEAPENSLANIENCVSKGYEIFETDIQRTKDGHFVMAHDPTIKRETSGTGKVSSMTLAELKSLHKRYRDRSLSPERVATLPEFLDRSKDRTVFKADMKGGVSKYFPDIMKLVAEHNAIEGIIFRVPYKEADQYAKYREQGGVIAEHTLMFKVSSREQVDDIKTRFDSSTIEITLSGKKPTKANTLDLIRYATSKGFVVETHAEGGEEDWVKLIDAGVRIFHTKTPTKMKKVLAVHKEQTRK